MFALVSAAPGDVDLDAVAAMGAALRGSARTVGTWRDAQGRMGVAAAATGILPEDAFDTQPLVSETLVFAAQARIDNREELLEQLDEMPERGVALADSEVLACAYRRWGRDCVQRVQGDFAFAAWHRDSGALFASVNHLASVQLYYAQSGRMLFAATQLGALLAHPRTPRDPNLRALGLLIAPKIEAGTTAYRDIRSLMGGHCLAWRAGTLSIERWWNPDRTVRARHRDPRDYACEAREVFDRAVAARLRAVGGVSSTLSGGLDSTLVAATAAGQLADRGETLDAYTSAPEPGVTCAERPGWDNDDTPFAAAVAACHPNMRHAVVSPTGTSPLDVLPELHARSHTPVRNGVNLPWFSRILAMSAAAGRRVLLSGDKGNATLSPGSDWATGAPQNELPLGLAIRLARTEAQCGGPPALHTLVGAALGPGLRERLRPLRGLPPARQRPGGHLLDPGFYARHSDALETFAPHNGRDALSDFMVAPFRGWSLDPMAHSGVEIRDPSGDRRLIETVLTFPWEGLFIGARGRGLARAMGEGRVPDSVRLRQTRGEQVPEIAALIVAQRERYLAALARATRSDAFRSTFAVDRVRATIEGLGDDNDSRYRAHSLIRVLDVGLFLAGIGA